MENSKQRRRPGPGSAGSAPLKNGPPSCLEDFVPLEIGTENVLWADSPEPWAIGRRYWPTSLIGIPWTAVSVGLTLAATGKFEAFRSSSPPSIPFTISGLMFVALGLIMSLYPLIAYWTAKRSYYILTENRAVIFEKVFTTKITSIYRDSLSGFERVSYGGKQGDLVFRRTVTGTGKNRQEEVVGFLGLKSFQEAEFVLRGLLESRKEA
jgi:hypothetical protein